MTQATNNIVSRQVKVGKRNIFISEAGRGYPIIMLHGGGPGASGLSNFNRNIAALAEHFHVIVPDMPGYGQSTKGINRADPFGDLADTILGLMDALQIRQAHLIGNSYGGACALRMALDQPHRVSAMILMGPGGINTTRALPTAGLNQLLNYYSGEGASVEKLRTFIREYLVFDGSQVPESVIQERYKSSIDPEVIAQPPLRRPNSPIAALKMDFTRDPRLKKCRVPTLVLWGINDKVNRPSGAETLQKTLLDCDVYLFGKTGHWVQWERADEFNSVAVSYLQQRTSTGV